jgi:two-component system NtrC family sensor kinase
MSALLAGVAHELNNPLAVVVGRAGLLSRQLANGPLETPVTQLAQAAERCARIVKNFLALARQRPPERQEVDLNRVAHEALELMAYALRVDNIEVTLDLEPSLPVLWADPHQLHQVIVNLVSNAHHAMREMPPDRPRRLIVRSRADGALKVTLVVEDTGPGISPEVRTRLFEPFFTTKPVGQGTGLGLSLCRAIVDAHGGQITLISESGQGASFQVDLPVLPPGPPDGSQAVEEPLGVPGKRILVVDDEPELAEMVAEVLTEDGQLVETAANGQAALRRLDQAPFDLVVSDIRMPELDGPGLYEEICKARPELGAHMIFLTGDTLDPAPRQFLERVGLPYLTKPFGPNDIRRAVRLALARV